MGRQERRQKGLSRARLIFSGVSHDDSGPVTPSHQAVHGAIDLGKMVIGCDLSPYPIELPDHQVFWIEMAGLSDVAKFSRAHLQRMLAPGKPVTATCSGPT